ncbi:DUF551 domain-containing protein [Escherichia coli]
MTTITKDRLLTIKQWRETYGPGSNVVLPAEEAEELARIALASLEAEPVLYMNRFTGKTFSLEGQPGADKEPEIYVPLYAAPPAPVVPDKLPREHMGRQPCHQITASMAKSIALKLGAELNNEEAEIFADGYNAAVLHGAKPVSQTYKLNKLSGNSPVTPDGWISCSDRMPAQDDWILIYSKHGEYMAGQVQGEYVELSDGTLSWLGNALYWMPLPEPPKEVNRG